MPTLSTRGRRRKGEDVENPPTVQELGNGTRPPVEIARKVPLGPPICFPPAFVSAAPPTSAFLTFAELDSQCEHFGRVYGAHVKGVWTSSERIAEATDQGESTVRATALPWMEDRGWIRRQQVRLKDGRVGTMIWCLWRFPDPFEGVVFPGEGFAIEVNQGVATPVEIKSNPARPARRRIDPPALSFSPGAPNLAPGSAPRERESQEDKQNPVNVSGAAPAGEREPAGPDHPAETIPPAPPAVAEMTVEEAARSLAGQADKFRWPLMVARELWTLADHGVPIPAPWDRAKMPPRPAPVEAPPQPPPKPEPSPAATRGPTTVDLIRRLSDPCGPESIRARAREVAARTSEAIGDLGWRNGHAKWFEQVIRGERKVTHALKAWEKAQGPGVENRGRVFKYWLDELPRMEAELRARRA